MPNRKRTRRRYSEQSKATILAAAGREGLTAADVQKRFGVVPVTYYSWRKNAGAGKGQRVPGGRSGSADSAMRQAVRTRLGHRLAQIVREETERYLSDVFGPGRKGRRS